MPKYFLLSSLFEQLAQDNPAPVQPDHFLFLMGTDVKFTPTPTARIPRSAYERGETLSYSAKAIVSVLDEAAEYVPTQVLSYSSSSVDVLDGVTTLGSEVGDRIARAVFLALRAAASGKTTLQITAFSRGGAEAILVMHEIKRIKDALTTTPGKSLKDILLDTPCTYTRAAIATLFGDAADNDTPTNRSILLQRLTTMAVNPFLIDPVPGDSAYYIPIGWTDSRFCEELPCTRYELLLCRDERTTCFYPVVPRNVQPTVIPGHHGSPCGNRYDHVLGDLPLTIRARETESVQDLVLLKLFHFMHSCTGRFTQTAGALALEHPELDSILNAYLQADKLSRNKQLCDKYVAVKQQDEAFSYFTTTNFSRFLGSNPARDGHRQIHRSVQSLESMAPFVSKMQGTIFNSEHAKLHLSKYVHLEDNPSPLEQARGMQTLLSRVIQEATPSRQSSTALFELVNTEEGAAIFSEGLSALVEGISQQYLNNHLTDQQKYELMQAINEPFQILERAIGNEFLAPSRVKFQAWKAMLQEGVQRTINTHYSLIYNQYMEITERLALFLATPAQFQQAYTEFLEAIPALDGDDVALLASIKERLVAVTPVDITSVKTNLLHEIGQIDGLDIDVERKVALKAALTGEHSKKLQAFQEAHDYTREDYLLKMQELHVSLDGLYQGYPTLKTLAGELNQGREYFRLLQLGIVDQAAKLLRDNPYNLPDTSPITPQFFSAARAKMIGDRTLLAPDPAFDAKEAKCMLMVENEKRPLTHSYLLHLFAEAKKYIPALNDDYMQALPPVTDIPAAEHREAYGRIKTKIDFTQKLYGHLIEPIPYYIRAENFQRSLAANQQILTEHRDAPWVGYTKAALNNLVTGIVPGALYTMTSGHSTFFSGLSHGAAFVQAAKRQDSTASTPGR